MPRSEAAKPKRLAKKAAKKVKPLTMEELVKWAVGRAACREGVARTRRFKVTASWWARGKRSDRLWVAYRLGLTHRSGGCGCGACLMGAEGILDAIAWPDVEALIIAKVRR